MTHNAVRAHLSALVRAGLVREGGRRRGVSRPTVVYELAPRADSALSQAYVPFVAHLLRALGERMSPDELHGLMHAVGLSLAAEQPRLRGRLPQRVEGARALLADLGALTDVEPVNHGFIIRGYGCCWRTPCTGARRCVGPWRACWPSCSRCASRNAANGERPRCCFRIDGAVGDPDAVRRGVA